jgi:glycosyltransferase involved in cell wall biosynthesis
MSQYIFQLNPGLKIIFFNDESNLYVTENNLRGNFYQRLRNYGLDKLEVKACRNADVILTVTGEEESLLYRKGFKNAFTIPYGIDPDHYSFKWEINDVKSILFVGDYSHYPNRQAVRYLLKNILPDLTDKKIILRIVGRNTNSLHIQKNAPVEIYENVDDVRLFYYRSTLLVAPIFTGGGIRTKILEAALCGIPMVISPLANLGIKLSDDEAFICPTNTKFIEAINNFFKTNVYDKINRMRISARQKIENQFSEKVVKAKIRSIFNVVNS